MLQRPSISTSDVMLQRSGQAELDHGAWPADESPSSSASPHQGDLAGSREEEAAPAEITAKRVMRDVAAERADDASVAVLGATLLMIAGGAAAFASVDGGFAWGVVAGGLCLLAASVTTVIRLRIQRELQLIGETHGMSRDDALSAARALTPRFLRLD